MLPSQAEAQSVLVDYSGDILPETAQPAWKLIGGSATESIQDGCWVIRNVQNFSRIIHLPSSKDRYDGQEHELVFRWASTARDTLAADGVSVHFAGRRFRLFPLKLADGRSVLLTGTMRGCLLSEPKCHVAIPGGLEFDASLLNHYRVRWVTNAPNDYGFDVWINETKIGTLAGEMITGDDMSLGFEARAGEHILDDIRWSILKPGTRLPDAATTHALQQIARGRRQLFLDDAIIESTRGLKRVVNQPQKYAQNPVIRAGQTPWQTFRAQVYGTVLYIPDERKFKMWYLAGPRFPWEKPATKDGRLVCPNFQFTAYAESADGFRWELPVLGLVELDESKQNNVCRMATECAEGVAVVHDPHDQDPNRRYKAFYWEHAVPYEGSPVKPINGMSVSFSADGKNWKEHPGNPVIGQASDSGQQALWDPDRKVYRAMGRFGAGGRRVAMSESTDFVHWTPSRLVMAADAKDGPGVQVYGMGTTFYEGIFIGLPWMLHQGTTEKIDVELAVSRDCINWERVADRQIFIPNGKLGEWDAGIIFTASQPLQVVDDTVFIFYSGVQGNHDYNLRKYAQPGDADYEKYRTRATASIGVATIRGDSFVSMDAGQQEGTLLTRAFRWPADRDLHVNADVSAGRLIVEVVNETGQVLAKTRPMTGDFRDVKLSFDHDFNNRQREKTRLRFRLQSGKLYSFWLTLKHR